jgi:hypothetical protein
MSKKEKIDLFLNKWISRKLIAFLIASIALLGSKIDGDNWVVITCIYIGSQTAVDIVERINRSKNVT